MTTKPATSPTEASLLGRSHLQSETGASEGLRERKKKQTRQLISDTATGMFLEDGYEAVRVVDVAAACQVSEKTVYNYFPTKESLIFDRFEEMEENVRRAFGPEGQAFSSPVRAAEHVIVTELVTMLEGWDTAVGPPDPELLRRFADMIQQTPALRAAQWEMLDKMSQVAAEGIARRAGVSPDDPEPQIAANAILGLWRIQFRSVVRRSGGHRSLIQVRDDVIADVQRAANLIDSGLNSIW